MPASDATLCAHVATVRYAVQLDLTRLAPAYRRASNRDGYEAAAGRLFEALESAGRITPDDRVAGIGPDDNPEQLAALGINIDELGDVARIANGMVLDLALAVLGRDLIDEADYHTLTAWWVDLRMPLPHPAESEQLNAYLMAARPRGRLTPAERHVDTWRSASAGLTAAAVVTAIVAAVTLGMGHPAIAGGAAIIAGVDAAGSLIARHVAKRGAA